jgi:hypothetical protein
MTEPPYRAPASLPPDPYLVAWATLRRRRLLRRIAVGVLAYALASTIAVTFMLHGVALLVVALLMVCVVYVIVAVQRRRPFLCPRCGDSFFWGPAAEIGFARHCNACGLAAGTSQDQAGHLESIRR